MSDEDEELAYAPGSAELAPSDLRPTWMKQLHEAAAHWLKLLPQALTPLKRSIENIKDPLYRYFEREVNIGGRLLAEVRHDLQDLVMICEGKKKQTNHHRKLSSNLNKGIVPDTWRKYALPPGTTVVQWVHDFVERVKQLQGITSAVVADQSKALKNVRVWLGGLFAPEAYITATRQYVAQANAWSLEELSLEIQAASDFKQLKMDECSFGVTGLKLLGAQCVGGSDLSLTNEIWSELTAMQFKWTRVTGSRPVNPRTVTLPVYLHATRQSLLFTLEFLAAKGLTPNLFYERGVAIICTTQLG